MFLKVLNSTETHYGLKYQTGLNIDPIPFTPQGFYAPGGMHFTTPKFIHKFLDMGVYLREVTLPEDAKLVEYPRGHKWKADKIILGPRMDLGDTKTWDFLIENGLDVHAEEGVPLGVAAIKGDLEIVKYLVSEETDSRTLNDAYRLASYHGNTSVVNYLKNMGAV